MTQLRECNEIRGELLLRPALAHCCNGDCSLSEAAQREAAEVFMAAGREQNAARALNPLALTLLFQGLFVEGRELAQRSLELRRRHGKRVEPPLDTLAQACAMMGDLDEAERCGKEACGLALADGDMAGTACAVRGLAYVCAHRDRRDDALRIYYCAAVVSADNARYDEPLAAPLKKLVTRLQNRDGERSFGAAARGGRGFDAGSSDAARRIRIEELVSIGRHGLRDSRARGLGTEP